MRIRLYSKKYEVPRNKAAKMQSITATMTVRIIATLGFLRFDEDDEGEVAAVETTV